jgi:uncharacterized protein (TIGR02453 family)
MKKKTALLLEPKNFRGFAPGAFDFFRRLRRNNRREWFLKHKAAYESTLVAPMKRLLEDVAERLEDAGIPLAPNRKSPVLRIYRDIRFSNDKSPYKTLISASLYREGSKINEGVLYISFSDKERFAAAGFWQPERPVLHSWRERIVARPKEFEAVHRAIVKAGHDFQWTEVLKRLPRGYLAHTESPIAKYLKLTSFIVVRPITSRELRSSKLPAEIAKFAIQMKSLMEFGWGV